MNESDGYKGKAIRAMLNELPPDMQSFFMRRQRRAIWISVAGGEGLIVFSIASVALPAAILSGKGVEVPLLDYALNVMQCFAGVELLLPFAGLRLYRSLDVKNGVDPAILCTKALLRFISLAASIALLPGWNGLEREILCALAFAPIPGVNYALYLMLLQDEVLRAVRDTLHITQTASPCPAPDRRHDCPLLAAPRPAMYDIFRRTLCPGKTYHTRPFPSLPEANVGRTNWSFVRALPKAANRPNV